MKTTMNRRTFTGAVASLTALSASRVYGANQQVRLGFIGCGNRGDQLLDAFLDTTNASCIAFCDLNQKYIKHAAGKVQGIIAEYKDYRQLLENKDIDGVVISTPDHWHALQTVDSLQAGKHVYIEKPLSLCVAEGRAMVDAAHKAKKTVQVGFHRRSSNFCNEAVQLIQRKEIGDITMVRAFHTQNEYPMGIGNPTDEKPPVDLDWDKWVGPAPMKSYNQNRTFYRFRWFYDYSGGQLTNMGAHYLDMIHWALGVEAPQFVTALGGKLVIKDNREIPDTLEVVYQYPDTLVTFTQVNANGAPGTSQPGADIEFRGTKGTLYVLGKSYIVIPETNMGVPFPAQNPIDRTLIAKYRGSGKAQIGGKKVSGNADTIWHTRNFISSITNDKKPNCPIEVGHRSTTAALLGNIALKKRATLEWDAKNEQFVNNKEANQLLKYEYRSPYKFPTL
ncbi:MAG: Gfo/Idh/MocA family oxidoreductase [Planctomycetia bacterium]|nr:Gfo/Idh/MocA family oxidoreductase [Planctomycetia bacterium]